MKSNNRRGESRRTELRRIDSRRTADSSAAEFGFLIDNDLDFADQPETVGASRRRASDRLMLPRYVLIAVAICLLLVLGDLLGHYLKAS